MYKGGREIEEIENMIKLTSTKGGEPFHINPASIETIQYGRAYGQGSWIVTRSDAFAVKETPDEILALVREAKA